MLLLICEKNKPKDLLWQGNQSELTSGFFYVKSRGKGKVARRFIPRRKKSDRDFLRIVAENAEKESEEQKGRKEKESEEAVREGKKTQDS